MILLKIFAILDIIAAILLILAPFTSVPFRLLLIFALFLLVKKFIFKGDMLSIIDFGVGCYALLAMIFPILFFSIIASTYLFLKGTYSFIS